MTRIYVIGFGPANEPEDAMEFCAGSAGEAFRQWQRHHKRIGTEITANGPTRWVIVKATGEVVLVDRKTFKQVEQEAA